MRFPKKIRITGRVSYAVILVDSFKNKDTMGECDSIKREIRILKTLSKKTKSETLIHELLHAIEFEHCVCIPHKVIYELEGPMLRVLDLNLRHRG